MASVTSVFWRNANVAQRYLAKDPVLLLKSDAAETTLSVFYNATGENVNITKPKLWWCQTLMLLPLAMLEVIAFVTFEKIFNAKYPWSQLSLWWCSMSTISEGHVELYVILRSPWIPMLLLVPAISWDDINKNVSTCQCNHYWCQFYMFLPKETLHL